MGYYIKLYCGPGWLLAEEQLCIDGQTVVYVIMTVPGLGSAIVNHNAEFRIHGLNKKIPPHHPTKALSISRTHKNNTSHKQVHNVCPQNKIILTRGQQCKPRSLLQAHVIHFSPLQCSYNHRFSKMVMANDHGSRNIVCRSWLGNVSIIAYRRSLIDKAEL